MVITFCGHSHVADAEKVREWLRQVVGQFIHEEDLSFYLGGYGEFDRLAASVAREQKKRKPGAAVVLVLPYLNRSYDGEGYDYTVFPPLESVPPRYAILKRNEWMISQADVVITYVTHDWGGAAKSLAYAQKRKKEIDMLPPLMFMGSTIENIF